jgi:hypothetical protein
MKQRPSHKEDSTALIELPPHILHATSQWNHGGGKASNQQEIAWRMHNIEQPDVEQENN